MAGIGTGYTKNKIEGLLIQVISTIEQSPSVLHVFQSPIDDWDFHSPLTFLALLKYV